jgi:hypothetical protein
MEMTSHGEKDFADSYVAFIKAQSSIMKLLIRKFKDIFLQFMQRNAQAVILEFFFLRKECL